MKTVTIAAAQTVEFREDVEAALNCWQMSQRAPKPKALPCCVFRNASFRGI
jgi:hypothetical protein